MSLLYTVVTGASYFSKNVLFTRSKYQEYFWKLSRKVDRYKPSMSFQSYCTYLVSIVMLVSITFSKSLKLQNISGKIKTNFHELANNKVNNYNR